MKAVVHWRVALLALATFGMVAGLILNARGGRGARGPDALFIGSVACYVLALASFLRRVRNGDGPRAVREATSSETGARGDARPDPEDESRDTSS